MQYLAEQIGGDHVSVSTLTKPGVEPHDLELGPRQTAELDEAGYILYLKGIQPAVDKAIAQSGRRTRSTPPPSPSWSTTAPRAATSHEGEEAGHDEHGTRARPAPTRTSGSTR